MIGTLWPPKAKAPPNARALQAVARDNGFHPVREYFEGLRWDGTPRLDTLLVAYLHVDDTPYARAVGPRWLISNEAFASDRRGISATVSRGEWGLPVDFSGLRSSLQGHALDMGA